MKIIIIMSGIPCSGKSSWARKSVSKFPGISTLVISKDSIRAFLFGDLSKYKINSQDEKDVEFEYQKRLNEALVDEKLSTIILDNTHCREKYLDHYIRTLGKGNRLHIKFIDCSLTKALFRNILRKILTGRWIPTRVLRIMKSNYDHINREKYSFWTATNQII